MLGWWSGQTHDSVKVAPHGYASPNLAPSTKYLEQPDIQRSILGDAALLVRMTREMYTPSPVRDLGNASRYAVIWEAIQADNIVWGAALLVRMTREMHPGA